MVDESFFTTDIEVSQIISRSQTALPKKVELLKTSPVIRKEDQQRSSKMLIIGGDSDTVSEAIPPSIIVEKGENGQISRIFVKCSCGQDAELICEYQ